MAFAVVAMGALSAGGGASQSTPEPVDAFPPWEGQEDDIERALCDGEILSIQPVGHGITRPFRVELEFEGTRLAGLWKPIDEAVKRRIRESYKAEIAAYKISRLLGLDRVPPTVERRIDTATGSLQYWVEGAEVFADVAEKLPKGRHFLREMARMRIFDRLIDNPDRNSSNFLVDTSWRILYIDHSRALEFGVYGRSKRKIMPTIYDRGLIAQLNQLDLPTLQAGLGDLLPKYRLKSVLKARDRVIEHVEREVAARGEVVYYE